MIDQMHADLTFQKELINMLILSCFRVIQLFAWVLLKLFF